MKGLELIELTTEQKKNLPLGLRKIYTNKITFLEREMKLWMVDEEAQGMGMRALTPAKPISKIFLKKS